MKVVAAAKSKANRSPCLEGREISRGKKLRPVR